MRLTVEKLASAIGEKDLSRTQTGDYWKEEEIRDRLVIAASWSGRGSRANFQGYLIKSYMWYDRLIIPPPVSSGKWRMFHKPVDARRGYESTNMHYASRLAAPITHGCDRLYYMFSPGSGVAAFVENSYVEVIIGQRVYLTLPMRRFPLLGYLSTLVEFGLPKPPEPYCVELNAPLIIPYNENLEVTVAYNGPVINERLDLIVGLDGLTAFGLM